MNKQLRLKQFDALGRICIPKYMRDRLNIKNKEDFVEIYQNDDEIVIKRHKKICVFCGNDDSLTEFEGKSICTGCLKKIKDI